MIHLQWLIALAVIGMVAGGAQAQPLCGVDAPCPAWPCVAPPSVTVWPFAPPAAVAPCTYAYVVPPRCTMQRLRIWDAYHRRWVLWTNRVCE